MWTWKIQVYPLVLPRPPQLSWQRMCLCHNIIARRFQKAWQEAGTSKAAIRMHTIPGICAHATEWGRGAATHTPQSPAPLLESAVLWTCHILLDLQSSRHVPFCGTSKVAWYSGCSTIAASVGPSMMDFLSFLAWQRRDFTCSVISGTALSEHGYTTQDEHAGSFAMQARLLLELQPASYLLNLLLVHGQGFHCVWRMPCEQAMLMIFCTWHDSPSEFVS